MKAPHDLSGTHPGPLGHEIYASLIIRFLEGVYLDICERGFAVEKTRPPLLPSAWLFGDDEWRQNCLPSGPTSSIRGGQQEPSFQKSQIVSLGKAWKHGHDGNDKWGWISLGSRGHPESWRDSTLSMELDCSSGAGSDVEGRRSTLSITYLRSYEGMGAARVIVEGANELPSGKEEAVILDGLWEHQVSLPETVFLDVPPSPNVHVMVTRLLPLDFSDAGLQEAPEVRTVHDYKFRLVQVACCGSSPTAEHSGYS